MSQQEPSPVQLLQQSQTVLILIVLVQNAYSAFGPVQWRLLHRGCCLRCLLQQPSNRDSLQLSFGDLDGTVGVLSATSVCGFCCERVKLLDVQYAYAGCICAVSVDEALRGSKGG